MENKIDSTEEQLQSVPRMMPPWVRPMDRPTAKVLYDSYVKNGIDYSDKLVRGIRINLSNLSDYFSVFIKWQAGILKTIKTDIEKIDGKYSDFDWVIGQIPGKDTVNGVDQLYVMIVPVLQDGSNNWINPLDYDLSDRSDPAKPYEHAAAAEVYFNALEIGVTGYPSATSVSFYDFGQKDP